MRLPVDCHPVRHFRIALALTLGFPLAACGAMDGDAPGNIPVAAAQASGPAADYPMITGNPYEVQGTTYVPEDVLNYDEVGFVAADPAATTGITGAHHTLPLPSYVEVTSLDSGRTILVRLERRGPMDGKELIALSGGAMAQLGAKPGTPVRVRRVNPPEEQRALLRAGQTAPQRMDTPMSLVQVLKRRLPDSGSASLLPEAGVKSELKQAAAKAELADTVPEQAEAAPVAPSESKASEVASSASFEEAFTPETPVAEEQPPKPVAEGAFLVQAATFSTAERAEKAAATIGGKVSPSGKYFLLRTGPFATRDQAEASLAKVKAAGYTDARIFTNG